MSYDLKSVKLPVLTNTGLKAFVGLLKFPPTKALLMPKLLKDGGFPVLRAMVLEESPTFYPVVDAVEKGKPVDFKVESESVLSAPRENPVTSARTYYAAYRDGKASPSDVAEKYFDAVDASNAGDRPVRAIIACNRDDVREQAQASAQRFKDGKPLSALDGVPVAIKDELDVVPYPTTAGTSFLTKPVTADSALAARLRDAGALLVGKANMHEIGINPNGFNMHYGVARNPHNLGHDTGGSSSGPAAAVACGLSPIAVGADGGGSIRVPAAHCGVVGLKATFGRFSEHGVAPLCWSVGHVGPLTATVEDAVLVYLCMAGPDERDPRTLHQGPVTVEGWDTEDLKGLKAGIFRPWFEHATPDVVKRCNELVEVLTKAGVEIVEVDIPELNPLRVAHAITILSEMDTTLSNHRRHFNDLAPSVQMTLCIAKSFGSRDYVQAQKMRTRAMAIFAGLWKDVDVLLTPATGATAPAIRENATRVGWSDLSTATEIMRYMIPGNMVGMPGISFPAGYDSAGLPVGMQAMAPHWREDLLFRVARVAERHVERRQPDTYFELI